MTDIKSSWGSAEPEFNEGNQQDQLASRFETARLTFSTSGRTCKVLAVISIAAGGFIALMGGPNALGAAALGVGSGASMGALGSIASNAKRAAAFAELQAWLVVQNSKEAQ